MRLPLQSGAFSPRWRILLLLNSIALVVVAAPAWSATTDQFNGTWVLAQSEQETFEAKAQELTEKLNEANRKRAEKRFIDSSRRPTGDRFYAQQESTERTINEDARSISWSLDDDLRAMFEAESIKLYQARLCAILYDKKVKRLIALNPNGRSYSRSGNEIAHDAIGKTVGFFENGALVLDTDLAGGDRLIEHFSLDAAGDELTLEIKLRRRDLGRTLEFKRVYTRGS